MLDGRPFFVEVIELLFRILGRETRGTMPVSIAQFSSSLPERVDDIHSPPSP